MNSNKDINKSEKDVPVTLFKIISAAFIFSVAALGGLAFSVAITPNGRYFTDSASVSALNFMVLPALILVVCTLLSFTKRSIDTRENAASRISAIFTAVGATVPFIYYIYSSLLLSEAKENGKGDTLLLLLAIASVAVFVFSLSPLFKIGKTATLLSGYCQVIFCVIIVARFYLDYSVELNSPLKLLLQFAAVAVMMSTLSDLRYVIDRPIAPLFVITKLFSAALPILYFIAFVAEIAPNLHKYSLEYAVFVPFFLFYGIASAVKLTSFRLESEEREEENLEVTAETGIEPESEPEEDAQVEAEVDASAEELPHPEENETSI